MFTWVLQRLAEHGLIKGERIGVDASTMEANAALRSIVRRDSGEGYRDMLTRMAKESGIATPTADDLVRLDRKRKGKKLSNADWESPTDPDARIAKLKDGRTRLAYKPEHAVDLDTGAVIAAECIPPTKATPRACRARLKRGGASGGGRGGADTRGAGRTDRRQRLPLRATTLKSLADGPWKTPHRRARTRWLSALAWRRCGPAGGL